MERFTNLIFARGGSMYIFSVEIYEVGSAVQNFSLSMNPLIQQGSTHYSLSLRDWMLSVSIPLLKSNGQVLEIQL